MSSSTTDLSAVRKAAANHINGRRQLDLEIRKARRQGATLRAIAEAADLAHETVRKIAS